MPTPRYAPPRQHNGINHTERLLEGQQTGGNVQLLSDRDKDMANETVVVPDEDEGGVDSGKEAVQPSPTNFDASRMPRTVGASGFIRAVTEAQALRVQIEKCLKLCDRNITELRALETEKGEEDSDQEDFDETQA